MTANTVNGSGNGARSGAQTLVMLAAPLNATILRALADEPKTLNELRREAGSPALTTIRAQLKRLAGLGTIAKHRRDRFPGILEYELTRAGRDLLFVADVLEGWFSQDPHGPMPLGGSAGKAATSALAEGWSTTMLRALAAAPLSLTELDGVISGLSYPSLERRLAAMRLAGQVEAHPGNGRTTPYAITDWLRHGVAPLAVAARWEQRHRPQASPKFSRLDIEAAFLLAMPLLRLPAELSGTCRMAMESANGGGRHLAGVIVEVEHGGVVSCTTQLGRDSTAWALGSPAAWLSSLIEHDVDRLELGGDGGLARTMLEHMHWALFGSVAAEIRPSP